MLAGPHVNGSFPNGLPSALEDRILKVAFAVMPRLLLLAAAAALVHGCGGNSPPAAPPTEEAARIECDRFAARAIQTGDPAEAARLTSRATDCYAALDSVPE